MYNLDDKHLTLPGFEPSTSEFLATSGLNEASETAKFESPVQFEVEREDDV